MWSEKKITVVKNSPRFFLIQTLRGLNYRQAIEEEYIAWTKRTDTKDKSMRKFFEDAGTMRN